MATSQNGRTVLESYGGPLVSTVIPGTDGAKFLGGVLGGDVNTLAMYIGARWHKEVEPIVAGWCWGYNLRPIRGASTGYSNHSSGTAGDVNAPIHKLDTKTLTRSQLDTLRSIQLALRGAVRFGAFYDGRVDEMHWEVITDDSHLATVANLVRSGQLPNVPAELVTSAPLDPRPPVIETPESEDDDVIDYAALAEALRPVIRDECGKALSEQRLDSGPKNGVRLNDVRAAQFEIITTNAGAITGVGYFTHAISGGRGVVDLDSLTWRGMPNNQAFSDWLDDQAKRKVVPLDFGTIDPDQRAWTQVA